MNKQLLVEQLAAKLKLVATSARRAGESAAIEAREGATPAERRDDARVAIEYAGLARGQAQRAERANADLAALGKFEPRAIARGGRIELGAVVEIESDEGGRTLFLAPVGAGEELTGEGGDGFLSVITPNSPIGRQLLGKCQGDCVEVTVQGEPREWSITWVE